MRYNVKRTQFFNFFFAFHSFFQTLLPIAINPLYHVHDLPKVLELISSGRWMHCVPRLRIDTSIAATLLCSHFRFDTACNMRASMLSQMILPIESLNDAQTLTFYFDTIF